MNARLEHIIIISIFISFIITISTSMMHRWNKGDDAKMIEMIEMIKMNELNEVIEMNVDDAAKELQHVIMWCSIEGAPFRCIDDVASMHLNGNAYAYVQCIDDVASMHLNSISMMEPFDGMSGGVKGVV
jgi:hypothetical protein